MFTPGPLLVSIVNLMQSLEHRPAPRPRRLTLSIIIPVYNERDQIGQTLLVAAHAVADSGFDPEFVVVDDGSTDDSGDVARKAHLPFPLQVVAQSNQGRISARRAGLAAAAGEFALCLDSRVRLEPGGLAFVFGRVLKGELVWNAHVEILTEGNPYGKFWKVITRLAWPDYLAHPRTVSFDTRDFDRYPKGTTGFLAPTELLRDGFGRMGSYYRNERYANDDTSTIRWIASQQPIHISPRFACTYQPRKTLMGFLRHAFHRGTVFVDGHGRPESRLFPFVIGFYPLSLVAVPLAIRHPKLAGGALAVGIAGAAGFALRRGSDPDDAVSFAALAPLYLCAHGAGMWRGLGMLLAKRLTTRR